ncbi:hypothetical protein LTR37_016388 [Vermiconidia calcicola]|uniref:Uncharacterized protein n=1 Tax=Vermiconidia calcicola TaxID=1690605 RepID=A0ACC3MNK8_9PEZI|nr:hypothetical protein LTR37_016388 [Vermiconidia calcicola]
MVTPAFGRQMRDEHFLFAKSYVPLNHGSYGAFPAAVRTYQRSLQDQTEARSDAFIRFKAPSLLLESRTAIAGLLQVPRQTVVFVPNATTGVNTVLRNLTWNEGDVIVYLSTAYGACEKTIVHVCEITPATSVRIDALFPIEDDELVDTFRLTVQNIAAQQGKHVKIAMFDTVCTFPGVRLPWEALVKACKAEDGAHGIGHIDLSDLGQIDPDFFTSNCYKWLFTPRPCAIFYVPTRHHHLIRTTYPTSHGFRPLQEQQAATSASSDNDYLGELFKWAATVDMSPYLCTLEALKFRSNVCGGEAAIRNYCFDFAQQGGKRMAQLLETEVMDNKNATLSQCCFAVVRLPLRFASDTVSTTYGFTDRRSEATRGGVEYNQQLLPPERGPEFVKTIMDKLRDEYDTWIPMKFYSGAIWFRISAQVYLDMADLEWAAGVLSKLCKELPGSASGS